LSTATIHLPLDRVGRGEALTAFERDVLPGFTCWLIEEIERRRPDYLIPVETKGARVLEAALHYAAEELGTPITVPVLYGIALAYIDRAELAELRLLIIDDAVRTGANLEHHRRRAVNYGARDVQTIACIGDASEAHDGVECYLTAEQDVYRQYVSELAELVTARGLPPEVDHHVFEVRLPVRVAGAWGEIERMLSRFGALTVDAPAEAAEAISGMTLHFPRLPLEQVGGEGEAREEIDKIRLFPDLAENRFHVIPVRFPALRLAEGVKETDVIDPGEAAAIVARLLPRPTNPARLLLSEARTLNAKTLFRTISTGAEIESMIGFAALLRETFPEALIEAHPESFARLYGERCGSRVAAAVAAALDSSDPLPVGFLASEREPSAPRYLDDRVVETTERLITELRRMYDRARERPGHDRSARIGLSVPEIIAHFGDVDPLLVSRCIDFGMARTTLVPFTGFDGDGETCVQRKYRVSELPRGREAYADRDEERVEISEQVVALLCHNLIERCREEGRTSVAPAEMARLVAVMRPLVLARLAIALCVRPAVDRVERDDWESLPLFPEVMLCADGRPTSLEERISQSNLVEASGEGLVATPAFKALYLKGDLKVALAPSVETIEAEMKNLLSLLSPLPPAAREELLEGWAKSTDHRLGLTHVRHSLAAACALIEVPLRLIRRGSPHAATPDTAALVERHCRIAAKKIEQLTCEWEKPVKDKWGESSLRLERAAVVSMAAPERQLALYQLPSSLADLITGIGALCERLDRASEELWLDSAVAGQTAVEVTSTVVAYAAEVKGRLTSLEEGPVDPAPTPSEPMAALALAAEELFDLLRQVQALLAAMAGDYRGPKDARLVDPPFDKRNSSVLSLDIAGSRRHEREHRETHNAWKNEGLDIAAQWARALTGREGKHREGDDIWFEFAVGDEAVIAAALIQAQAEALASTGIDEISRDFHVAVDAGELEQANVGTTNGHCMDTVTKIAKAADRSAETTHVFVSPEAWRHCSTGLRDAGVRAPAWEREIVLDDETKMNVVAVDSGELLRRYCERLAELGQATSRTVGALPATEAPITSHAAETAEAGLGEAASD
jgi:hypothetical protein